MGPETNQVGPNLYLFYVAVKFKVLIQEFTALGFWINMYCNIWFISSVILLALDLNPYLMNPFPSLSNTLKADLISSSWSSSCICFTIIVINSVKSMVPLPVILYGATERNYKWYKYPTNNPARAHYNNLRLFSNSPLVRSYLLNKTSFWHEMLPRVVMRKIWGFLWYQNHKFDRKIKKWSEHTLFKYVLFCFFWKSNPGLPDHV